MSLSTLITTLRSDARFMATVAAWHTLPAQPPRTTPFPPALDPRLVAALEARGISRLYTHQAAAAEVALAGGNVAVVTPTASGKTLCYNLPVFHRLLNDPDARALYLFPTKALAQDQLAELNRLAAGIERLATGDGRSEIENRSPISRLFASTYDGDTPSAERPRIRKTARILLTNPDMLHVGILPYHTQWADVLAGLRWVVIDEMHTYRGVFGSQVANVLRRLQRLCTHYGSRPQFVCTSATIANPQMLAARLLEQPVTLVNDNGAPRGEKQIILVNPPLLDPEKGIRRNARLEATDLAAACLRAGLQTIVFGRSRLATELLLTYLRDKVARGRATVWEDELSTANSQWSIANEEDAPAGTRAVHNSQFTIHNSQLAIRGYRGGYLPLERRAIEAGLRNGEVHAVVATNALELGIDIGQLQAAVICGYPGSIASTWQQMGRAGRTTEGALALLVATGGPLDQYIVQHPEFIFERSPEHALVNPDNLMLLVDQVRCAAFELPFAAGDRFGASPFVEEALRLLAEEGDLHCHATSYFWSGASYPARSISLRRTGGDGVVIQAENRTQMDADFTDQAQVNPRNPRSSASHSVIGEVDRSSAPRLVHEGAIYLHEGQSYLVKHLDLTALRADTAAVEVDYFTETMRDTQVAILTQHAIRNTPNAVVTFGDVDVTEQVVGYRRIKRHTHETLGHSPLEYPPYTLTTSAYWLAVQPAAQDALARAGLWYDSSNDYGPNWQTVRRQVRARDHCRCTQCGAPEPPAQEHDVHHRIPFRTFGYVAGVNENYLLANRLENLVLVCRACHQRIETAGRVRTGLDGLAYLLANLAPLHLMCDVSDLGVYVAKSEVRTGDQRLEIGDQRSEIGDQRSEISRPSPISSLQSPISSLQSPISSLQSPISSLQSPVSSLSSPRPATIYLYERIPAGLGFSALLFELHDTLLAAARVQIDGCPCQNGCPACVGPVLEEQPTSLATKRLTLGLLDVLG